MEKTEQKSENKTEVKGGEEEEELKAYTAFDNADLPVLDFSEFLNGDEAAKKNWSRKLLQTLVGPGFYYLKNHGIPQELIDFGFQAINEFFELSVEEKMKVLKDRDVDVNAGYTPHLGEKIFKHYADHKQVFDFNTGNINSPKHHEILKQDKMVELYTKFKKAGWDLSRAYALALNLPERFFADKTIPAEGYKDPSNQCGNYNFRMVRYPPIPKDERAFGCGPHSDYLTITLLAQDGYGLQVWNNSTLRWENAPPIPGTLVINTGNLMQHWTNDLLISNLHRVIPYSTEGIPRYSMILFDGPYEDAVVDNKELFEAQPQRPATTGGKWYTQRMYGLTKSKEKEEEVWGNADALKNL